MKKKAGDKMTVTKRLGSFQLYVKVGNQSLTRSGPADEFSQALSEAMEFLKPKVRAKQHGTS